MLLIVALLLAACVDTSTKEGILIQSTIDALILDGNDTLNLYPEGAYEDAVCNIGISCSAVDNRRAGCVNEKTMFENYQDYNLYRDQRDQYLSNP